MAKVIVFLAVFLAALVSAAVAQDSAGEIRFRDAQCQSELQDRSLDACRRILDRQLTGQARFRPSLRGTMGLRSQCCQQVQDINPECRCAAIRRMVRDYEQSMPAPAPLDQGFQGSAASHEEETWGSQDTDWYHDIGRRETRQAQVGQVFGEASSQQVQGQDEDEYGDRHILSRPDMWGSRSQQPTRQEFDESTEQQQPPHLARVRLIRARQYAAQLPSMCWVEPQQCNIFSAGQF